MDPTAAVRAAFPSVADIADQDLRDGVIAAWSAAITENDIETLEGIPWFPPVQSRLGLPDEDLVTHVREVVRASMALVDVFVDRQSLDLSRDVVLAAALVHDVSKLYEFDGHEPTRIEDLLGHPHYGVHVAAEAGLPVEVLHAVAAHSTRTAVEPATIEAEIVRRADEAAAAAIRAGVVDDLREA